MLELEYSTAVSSEFKDGALLIGADLLGSDGHESGRGMKSIQPLGLLARPRDPQVDSQARPTLGAGLVHSFEGGEAFAWPTTDPRALTKIPPIKPGGTVLYSFPGGFVNLDGDNGSLLALTPDGNTGKNHAFSMDGAASSLQWRHADGMGIAITRGGLNSLVLNNKAGTAYIEINDNGINMNGNTVYNGGMVLGQVASALPVALAPALQQWEQVITEVVGKLATAVNIIAPGTVDPALFIQLFTTLFAAAGPQGVSTKLSASP